ncbi:MAG: DNA-directed RNA polymerase subunit D [Candidatus Aenigmarchaeota archaeon]|nr:DNA-directed RNA polymerase subunit D [Candidatus Aenigmarchaeota archaeon]
MEVEVLERANEKLKLHIKDVTPGTMAILRRVILSEIPTMAIEWVDFIKNDSIMPDEVLANRLGQIPLTFDPKAYKLPEECKCEGKDFCPECQVKLYLKKTGPCVVYSGDLKSTDETVKPVYNNIPIIELMKGEELEFEAIAQLGRGKDHAKWQAGILAFYNVAKIHLKKGISQTNMKKLAEVCPKGVFKIRDGHLHVDKTKCNLCNVCAEKFPNLVTIEPSEDEFIATIETTSGIPVEELIPRALDEINKKLTTLKDDIKRL